MLVNQAAAETPGFTAASEGQTQTVDGHTQTVDIDQAIAMLRILHAACSTALQTLQAAGNPVDEGLVADLKKMVERTHDELNALTRAA